MAEQHPDMETASSPGAQDGAVWQRLNVDMSDMMPFGNPAGRMLIGFVFVLAMTMMLFIPLFEGAEAWAVIVLLFGAWMMLSAVRQSLARRRFRNDVKRAVGEWAELVDAARQDEGGGALARTLRQRGYGDYFVRRWLLAILKEGQPQRAGSELRELHGSAAPMADPPDERTWLQLCDQSASMMPITNPKLRMVLGTLMSCGAIGFFGVKGVVFQWGIMFGVMGLALLYSGYAQVRRFQSVRDELSRARDEWPSLQEAAQGPHGRDGGFVRELTERGYRDYSVRRWVVSRLQPRAPLRSRSGKADE